MSTHRCSPPRRSQGSPWKRAVTMSMRRSGVAVIRHYSSRPWVEKGACSRSTAIRRPSRPAGSVLPTKCGLRSCTRRLPTSARSCRHTRTIVLAAVCSSTSACPRRRARGPRPRRAARGHQLPLPRGSSGQALHAARVADRPGPEGPAPRAPRRAAAPEAHRPQEPTGIGGAAEEPPRPQRAAARGGATRVNARAALIIAVPLLWLAALGSAAGAIYCKHRARQMVVELEALNARRDNLEIEWGQLQLEQSAWSTHAFVERVASAKLRMAMPPPKQIEIVAP